MRKLAWAAGAFSAAVFLAEYLLPVKGLPYIAAVLLVVSPLSFLAKGKMRLRLFLSLLCAALGFAAFGLQYAWRIAPCEQLRGERLNLTVRVTDYPTETGRSHSINVRLLNEELPQYRARFYLYDEAMPELVPGDILRIEVKISDEPDGMADKNILLFGSMTESPVWIARDEARWRYIPQELAQRLKEGCLAAFSDESAPFAIALLTGDTSLLKQDNEAYSDLRLAGVAHAVVVSGMHTCYLVGFIQTLFGRGRRSSLLCFPILLLFALMTGATPSVLRAVLMQSLLLLAPMFDRERDAPTALCTALALLLLINPRAAGSISLQLSFAAAAGMEWLLPAMRQWRLRHARRRIPAFVPDSLACTVGASVFTVPLAALYFGTIPLLAPVANLLTLTLLSWIFIAGFALALVGLLWPYAAALFGWLPSQAVALCQWLYARLAAVPNGCLYTDSRAVVLWLAAVYVLFALFYLLRDKKRRFRPLMPAALSIAALALLLIGSSLWGNRGAEFTALDVGQGSCSILRTEGAVLVVDCGGNGLENAGDTAANYLLSHGQRDVDALLLTHLHADHTNGAAQLMHRMTVRRLYLPADAQDEENVLALLYAAAAERGTEIVLLDDPMRLQLGRIDLQLHQPLAGEDINERGIVLWGTIGDKTVAITGDLGAQGELALLETEMARPTDILLVGHHGSDNSSTHLFLYALRPECAIISVGENYYGHPAVGALERLYAYAGELRRTDFEGNITIRID